MANHLKVAKVESICFLHGQGWSDCAGAGHLRGNGCSSSERDGKTGQSAHRVLGFQPKCPPAREAFASRCKR